MDKRLVTSKAKAKGGPAARADAQKRAAQLQARIAARRAEQARRADLARTYGM